MKTVRKTVAQATVEYLRAQYTERDDMQQRLIAGCFGIFGHGNVAGLGQALNENRDFRYYPFRNEQAMVHAAAAYAKVNNRLSAFACTSSIGPGSTNMITGAALATINRLPVLLLPGDLFARRNVAPVLQQLESSRSQDISVNDSFKPVSQYWDRINRAEQLITSLPRAMQVLTSPSETGAVTLSMPQDVQAEAFDFPVDMFEERIWTVPRPRADRGMLQIAIDQIKMSKRPVIIAGGGVIYSEATESLLKLIDQTGIPVVETMAGMGSVPPDHPSSLGAVGVTGSPGGVAIPQRADLVVGIGTRYSDFTTASKTLFQHPEVRFINVNISPMDGHKHGGINLTSDAKVTIEELSEGLMGWRVSDAYSVEILNYQQKWKEQVSAIFASETKKLTQGQIIGVVHETSGANDIMVCASGSLPGELHKLWRPKSPKNFHLEYGYSCMGYEIAGGLGAKMARPESEIIVMVGDGSYLMMSQEIVTSLQEGYKLVIVLIDNRGFSSIGSLSRSIGSEGFGTRLLRREGDTIGGDELTEQEIQDMKLSIDLASNARSLGAHVIVAKTKNELKSALQEAFSNDSTTLIYTEADRYAEVPGFAWWEVPISAVSSSEKVMDKYEVYLEQKGKQRYYDHLSSK